MAGERCAAARLCVWSLSAVQTYCSGSPVRPAEAQLAGDRSADDGQLRLLAQGARERHRSAIGPEDIRTTGLTKRNRRESTVTEVRSICSMRHGGGSRTAKTQHKRGPCLSCRLE